MKKLLLLVIGAALAGSALCQTSEEKAAAEQKFSAKFHILQLYNDILPIVFTKEELKAILPPIEKGRDRVRQSINREYDAIKPNIDLVDNAMKKADSGEVPPRDLMQNISNMSTRIMVARSVVAGLNEEDVYQALKANLKPAQIKIIANTVNPAEYGRPEKPDKLTEEEKVRMFAREVLLDPDAYPILVKLSK